MAPTRDRRRTEASRADAEGNGRSPVDTKAASLRPIVVAVLAVERERLGQAFAQAHLRLPSGQLGQPRVVDVDRADVDLRALRRPGNRLDRAARTGELL